MQCDGSSLRDHLQRRHEGYVRSDLLAATLRSNREVDDWFFAWRAGNFSGPVHPPAHDL
jgi:hypothetical protein